MPQIGCEREEVMKDLLMNRYKLKDFKEPQELRNVINHMAATSDVQMVSTGLGLT